MVIVLGWWLIIALSLLVIYSDIKSRKINDYFSVALALVCLGVHFYYYRSVLFFCPFLILFTGAILSVNGWLGGGDTKLFAAYSTAILPENLFLTVLLILIVGGVVSLCCLIKNKWTKSADRGVPYGVAIVIGSLFGIWMSL